MLATKNCEISQNSHTEKVLKWPMVFCYLLQSNNSRVDFIFNYVEVKKIFSNVATNKSYVSASLSKC